MKQIAVALAVGLGMALAAPPVAAQVNTTGTWSNMVVPNEDGTPYWDNTSADGAKCNVGYYLLYKAGSGFGPCSNEKPTSAFVDGNSGRLGTTGGVPNGSYLSESAFSFAAGKYRFNFLANIAGYDPTSTPPQELWIFTKGSGGAIPLHQLYAVGTYPEPLTTTFEFTIGSEWFLGARSAVTPDPWEFSNQLYAVGAHSSHAVFSLFSSGTTDPGALGNVWYSGFGDISEGDRDYNDLVVEIAAVPEPSAIVLLAIGVLGLVGRQRRVRI